MASIVVVYCSIVYGEGEYLPARHLPRQYYVKYVIGGLGRSILGGIYGIGL